MTRSTISQWHCIVTLLQLIVFSVAESTLHIEQPPASFLSGTLRHLKGVTQGLTRKRRGEPRTNKTKKLEQSSVRKWCKDGQACNTNVSIRGSTPGNYNQATARGTGMNRGSRAGWDHPAGPNNIFTDYNMSMEFPSEVRIFKRALAVLFRFFFSLTK